MVEIIHLPESTAFYRSVAPADYAVSLAELKAHLLVGDSYDDTLLTSILQAAIGEAEEITGKQLVQATYVAKYDTFPASEFVLYRPPLQSVTSITYVDTAGATQTVTNTLYDVDTYRQPGVIRLGYNKSWPTGCRGHVNDITITYKAGYGVAGGTDAASAAAVPEMIKSGIKLLAQAQYDPIRSGDSDAAETMRTAGINLLMMERCQAL